MSRLLKYLIAFALLAPVAFAQDFFLDQTSLEFDPNAGTSRRRNSSISQMVLEARSKSRSVQRRSPADRG